MNAVLSTTTVGQLVAERPGRARVFENHGIDFCCHGNQALDAACAEGGIPLQQVIDEIAQSDAAPAADETDWTRAALTELADHIEHTHHGYLRGALPRLAFYSEKVASAHGERHPEVVRVAEVFADLRAELEQHTMKEEMILFPLVRQIDTATQAESFHCGSVGNPIRVMEMEHDRAGSALETLRSLTNGYQAPEDACNTYRAMLDGLAELERDTHTHIHKENSILFPRAIAREDELNG